MTISPAPGDRLRSFQVRTEPRARYALDDDLFDNQLALLVGGSRGLFSACLLIGRNHRCGQGQGDKDS